MLTGFRLFAGDDMAETLADVIKGHVTLDDLPNGTPDGMRRLLRRCLQKDRAQRLDSAAIARLEIGEASAPGDVPAASTAPATSRRMRNWVVGVAAIGVAATAVTLTLVVSSRLGQSPESMVARFEISPPEGEIFPGANLIPRFAVSPDGTSVAFQSGIGGVGPFQLWIRRLDRVDPQPLPATSAPNDIEVQSPFWLADGSTLGYGGAQRLRAGEIPRALASRAGPSRRRVVGTRTSISLPARLKVSCVIPIPIHVFNPGPMTGDGNWTWLIPGRVPTLIDAGTGDPRHLDAVDRALGGQALKQVLVTHGHTDHASGAPALAARHPHAVFRKQAWPERDVRWPLPWHPIRDNESIEVGDDVVISVHTPGHAPDHMSFWHEESRTLLSGDLVLKGTTVYIPSNSGGDLRQYLASLHRVKALSPVRLLPAHGPVIDNPTRAIETYVSHRLERERQILEILGDGPLTPERVANRIYKGLKPPHVPLAVESVTAHLIKLEGDGRVRRTDGAWLIIDP